MKNIRYISTRARKSSPPPPAVSFEEALLAGLAPDGGLYVPNAFPKFSGSIYRRLSLANYKEVARQCFAAFLGDFLSPSEIKNVVDRAYSGFRHQAITPLSQLDKDTWLLELYHGESHSFKDIAMQVLAPLLDEALRRKKAHANILCATSGDTGSAAMAAFAKSSRANLFVLYPKGGISSVQRKQMTQHPEPHLHALEVAGSFDDCQKIVKQLFNDREFCQQVQLAAVNSINWARIMAQVVYYFTSCLALGANHARQVHFIVPTGNFGDIYAGFVAKKMGAPIKKLVIANNANDVLTTALKDGLYRPSDTQQTLAPAMDIQAPSNFERLLFEVYNRRSDKIEALFAQLQQEGEITFPAYIRNKIGKHFFADSIKDEEILTTIKECHARTNRLIDPHTATALATLARHSKRLKGRKVVLSTAAAAKFPEAIEQATGHLPAPLGYEGQERFQTIENNATAIAAYIKQHSQEQA